LVEVDKAAELYHNILSEVSKVVIGKEQIKESLLIALLAGGHVLIEGPPGSAKTTLASTFAMVFGGTFKRIQLTPDMMPSDITGFYLYSTNGNSSFVPGPIFANLVLADELNRTTPRTQAALLEAMQDNQVTIERKTYPLEKPFMVIATQVQTGGEGTYPLTDVQIDRFLLRVMSEYPSPEEEQKILSNIDSIDQHDVKVIASIEDIKYLQRMAKEIHVSPAINEYVVSLINNLRTDPDILNGPSTRASIALFKCARISALFDGRDFVIPDDIKKLAYLALEHRVRVKPDAEMDRVGTRTIMDRILSKTPVPKGNA
jgi:MoxR-like ATPase